MTRHAFFLAKLRDKLKQQEAKTAGDEPGKTGAAGGRGRKRGERAGGRGFNAF